MPHVEPLPAHEALARWLDIAARDYLLARYLGPGNPMGTEVLRTGSAVATRVPFAPLNPLMNTARGIEHPDELAAVLAFHLPGANAVPASTGPAAARRGCWVETAPYTPPGVTDALVASGFRLERQAATLYASLAPASLARDTRYPALRGDDARSQGALQVQDVGPADLPSFLDTINRGFGVPDGMLSAMRSNQSFWCDVPSWHLFLASLDGEVAGAAVLSVHDDPGQPRTGYLAAAATLTNQRGRGVQTALIAARIDRARALGCTLISGQAAWGSTSQANMQRAGMGICHLRTHWVRTDGERVGAR